MGLTQRYSWTQPCCNACWDAAHPDRRPTRVLETEDEICCFCEIATRSGIYVRVDPETCRRPDHRGGLKEGKRAPPARRAQR